METVENLIAEGFKDMLVGRRELNRMQRRAITQITLEILRENNIPLRKFVNQFQEVTDTIAKELLDSRTREEKVADYFELRDELEDLEDEK